MRGSFFSMMSVLGFAVAGLAVDVSLMVAGLV